ncbi:MAG: formylglycine-generating enzyme family protein [Gammaproteobacteria bacterium]|nr:formylglycine-generating enzyme family protein [Gammaproteobacteria bacterium]
MATGDVIRIQHNNMRAHVGLLLLLLLFWLPIDLYAESKTQDCVECHPDFKHKDLRLADENACDSCHRDLQDQHQKQQTIKSKDKPLTEPKLGLSMPQYYADSRIGADPNSMISIPAGEFIMGTNGRLPDEGPEHSVNLPGFQIDKYEVTNLQYKKFIDDTGRRSPKHFRNRTFPEGKADHPVTYVSWKDANAYCQWAGKRLPTDQEWEKAARGVDGRFFPWGNEFEIANANTPVRWTYLKIDGDTTPVGAFEAGKSPYGLYDMSGNVWEWTASWYQAYPGNTHLTENYGQKYKTLKGGSWWDCSFYQCGISAPVYNRSFFLRSTKNSSFGFRCAKNE